MYQIVKTTTFCGNQCDFYTNGRGQIYITAPQIGRCLGFSDSRKVINRLLVECNPYLKDKEFSVEAVIETPLGEHKTRLFTEEGVFAITILVKTDKSKDFRLFVRKIVKDINKSQEVNFELLEEIITKTAKAVATEVVKQLTCPPATTVIQDDEEVKQIVKPYKYNTPSKIAMLPPVVKAQVDKMIMSGNYSCQEIANYIIDSTGTYITQVSVNRYKHNNFATTIEPETK